MTVPVDPGDFAVGALGDANAVDARFLALYNYLNKTITGVDADAILNGIITRALVEAQPAWLTLALTGATWAPVNLSYYKDSLGVVRFRPERFTASADFATGNTFGTMPAGFRPGVKSYFACNRAPAGGPGSMGFSIATNGVMTAEQNFQPNTNGIAFTNVEYRAEN